MRQIESVYGTLNVKQFPFDVTARAIRSNEYNVSSYSDGYKQYIGRVILIFYYLNIFFHFIFYFFINYLFKYD